MNKSGFVLSTRGVYRTSSFLQESVIFWGLFSLKATDLPSSSSFAPLWKHGFSPHMSGDGLDFLPQVSQYLLRFASNEVTFSKRRFPQPLPVKFWLS